MGSPMRPRFRQGLPSRRFRVLPAAIGLACMAATACGSTVAVDSAGGLPAGGGAAAGDGLGATGLDGQPGGAGAPAGTDATTPTGAVGTNQGGGAASTGQGSGGGSTGTGTASGTGTSAGTATGSGTSGSPARVRGVTATTVAIGVLYADDGKKAIGAAGGTADRGREDQEYKILFDAINAAGGIAGRRIVPVFYEIAFGDQRQQSEIEQPACERFKSDQPVFAVLTTKAGGATDSFKRCVERAGIVHIAGNFTVAGAKTYEEFPHYAEPNGLGIERAAAAFTPSMAERKWFSGWNATTGDAAPGDSKVGIITFDYPTFQRAVDRVLVPALKKVTTVGPIVRLNPYDSGQMNSAVSSAVLQFRQAGVTHVAFLQSTGAPPLLFLQQANSQGYYPRYGFTSQDVMPLLHEAGLVPAAGKVFHGAKGVGWWPSADVTYGKNEYASRPAAKACMATLAKGGKAPSSGLQQTLSFFHCDVVNLLRSSLEASGAISPAAFRSGLDRLRSTFSAAGTIRSLPSTNRRDGVTAVRGFAWSDDCDCFVHDGPERPVP